jgi:hypothetical protein
MWSKISEAVGSNHLIHTNFVFRIVPLNYPAFSNIKVVRIVAGCEEKARHVEGRIG